MCGEGCSPVREVPGTRRRRESKEKTCAERGVRRIERAPAHAKEGKVRKRRVPGDAVADERERLHTPKRKSKEMTCSERRSRRFERSSAHARKKKARSSQEKQEKGRNI